MRSSAQWVANLELEFAHRPPRTALVSNSHQGPLLVQKALYPEGPRICHVTVLHPPGGMAGGDVLRVAARLQSESRVCLTTCGASKWYRCPQAGAQQSLRFVVGPGAALEWLPRENILFDGCHADMQLEVELASEARFFGWEILCFGRRASGEKWDSGSLRLQSRIHQSGFPSWFERAAVRADGTFQSSSIGLAGCSVSATFIAAGGEIEADLLGGCRDIQPQEDGARLGITAMPKLLVARYLGHSSQSAFAWFIALRTLLRPALMGQTAVEPRLWAC